MINNQRTRDYLKEMNAILTDSQVIVYPEPHYDKINIVKRDNYIKRNGKKCYVIAISEWIDVNWDKLYKFKNHKTYSTGENDWRPLHVNSTNYRLEKEYKQELIDNFKLKHNI